jgi:hypothetical protein
MTNVLTIESTTVALATTAAVAMNRIVIELESIVHFRLFGPGRWLADRETCRALQRRILQMGLSEHVPGKSDTLRNTPLGAELNLDLYEVFMGLWDEGEIPLILENYRLIDESLVYDIYARMEKGTEPEALLRGYVKHAYFDYHKATKYLN